MNLFLEIKNGELLGQKFKVQEGLRIGRTIGEVQLKDSKLSSLHAQIELNRDGEYVLVDRNSSNGIWVGEEKVKTVAMMRGVTFRLGKTMFMVVEEVGVLLEPSVAPKKERKSEWARTIADGVRLLVGEDAPNISGAFPFNKVLELKFISGPQIDETITLGYGPRKFGSTVMDVELKDPEAPFQAFEIFAQNGNPIFETNELKIVKVNYQTVQTCPIQDGDIISFGESAIRVSFLK